MTSPSGDDRTASLFPEPDGPPMRSPNIGSLRRVSVYLGIDALEVIQEQSEIKRLCENLGEVPWRAPPPIKLPLKHAA